MIRRYLLKRRAQIITAGVLSTVSAALSMLLLQQLNDVGAEGVLVRGLALLVLLFASSILSQTYLARFGSDTIADVRRDLSERYLYLDYAKLQEMGKFQVTASLVADVGRVATLFTVLPLFFFNAVLVLFSFMYLLVLAPRLFLVFAVFMAFAIGSSLYLMRRCTRTFEAIRDEEDKLFEHFSGIAEGKKELCLNPVRAAHFRDVLGQSIERNRQLGYEVQKWWNYGGTWSTTLIFGALLTVVVVGRSWAGAELVTIMQFVVVTLFLMNPLNYLIVASQDIAMGVTSVKKLKTMGVEDAGPRIVADAPPWRVIAAKGLAYDYPAQGERGFAFGPVDLTIKRGEVLFVVGGNGSGKSTLALLLTGLLTPSSGHLELDGSRVTDLSAYRRLFSTVFFDFYLFDHMLERDGKIAADERVRSLLGKVGLESKVAIYDGKLSTLDLSQGQRRRLALVQAYVDNGEIFLFDEWAADQDPEFKRYFYMELLPELKRRGKTVLAITHDERYFGCADRVLKFDQGHLSDVRRQAESDLWNGSLS